MNKMFCTWAFVLLATTSAVGADWTEQPGRWYAQSYWADAAITQSYGFEPFTDEKISGASSVAVTIDVSAEKPRDTVELRLAPSEPLDLSMLEALTISAKSIDAGELRLRDIYLCSPGFQKLATIAPPTPVVLKPGEDWKQIVFDFAEAQILDKKLEAGQKATYDRKVVETICINFVLPKGAVKGRLLLDGLHEAKLPPAKVVRKPQPDGGFEIGNEHYHVVIGANGYIQSIQAGKADFLTPAFSNENTSSSASAAFKNNDPNESLLALNDVEAEGRSGVLASGELLTLRYVFREYDFDVLVRQSATLRGLSLNFALSDAVVASLDQQTDRALYRKSLDVGSQISSRLVTSTGPVMFCNQHVVGYSRVATALLPGDVWTWQFLAWGSGWNKLTMRPVANPSAGEAIGVSIDCENEDFLLPADQPVSFDVNAMNYTSTVQRGKFSFQICDYLTGEVLAERITPFELDADETVAIPTEIEFDRPGVYRGRIIADGGGTSPRHVEWVFTYDFSHYKSKTPRPDDFNEFWHNTLAELAEVPLDVEMTLVPEQSDEHSEAYKVSLATLNGRRFYGWYWRPKAPGKYPVQLELPSSGIYKRTAAQVPHGPNYCGMWIAIHGLPVELDFETRPDDPAAWNYWTYGIESPQTSMWRTIYASMVRAVDFLCERPEIDPDRIMASGGSQGGGLTIILAGLDQRISFAAPAHNGLCRLDWTVKFEPGFWPFNMSAKPVGQSEETFLKTLSYFDAANFASEIHCPVFAEVSLLDTVTASGNQIAALTRIQPGLLELICDPWHSHASSLRGSRLRGAAINRWLLGEPPVTKPIKPDKQSSSTNK